MQIIVFSKMLAAQTVPELIETAHQHDFDGYDLCIRPGHPVTPGNVTTALPAAVQMMRRAGLDMPLVTSDISLTSPFDPTAEPILRAMDVADVRLIKIGYTFFDPLTQDYWSEVERIRRDNEKWQALAQRYNVKVCYHTHNERVMGINGAALCHLINGFDPQYIGAYLDPTHLVLEGEEFAFALAMVRPYLAMVAGKDVLKFRVEKNGHGSSSYRGVPAGEGFVDWTAVFSDLKRVAYDGPLSVACEWHLDDGRSFSDVLRQEVRFFKHHRDTAA
jgi:sugar phosphate isomerase/epimerase